MTVIRSGSWSKEKTRNLGLKDTTSKSEWYLPLEQIRKKNWRWVWWHSLLWVVSYPIYEIHNSNKKAPIQKVKKKKGKKTRSELFDSKNEEHKWWVSIHMWFMFIESLDSLKAKDSLPSTRHLALRIDICLRDMVILCREDSRLAISLSIWFVHQQPKSPILIRDLMPTFNVTFGISPFFAQFHLLSSTSNFYPEFWWRGSK